MKVHVVKSLHGVVLGIFSEINAANHISSLCEKSYVETFELDKVPDIKINEMIPFFVVIDFNKNCVIKCDKKDLLEYKGETIDFIHPTKEKYEYLIFTVLSTDSDSAREKAYTLFSKLMSNVSQMYLKNIDYEDLYNISVCLPGLFEISN